MAPLSDSVTVDLPARVDVVVLGATAAGLEAATGIAASGAEVLLTGPAGPDDLGLCVLGLTEAPARVRASLGPERWRELIEVQRRSAEGLDPVALVWAAVAPGEAELVEPSVEALREVGAAAEVLDQAALRALGISADAGFRVADGGGVLRPQAWRQDALAAAQRAGVQLVRTPVRWVEETLDGLKVSVSGAEVRCEVVVIAHGAAVARWSGWLADKLMPVREQALVAPGSAPVGRAGHGWTSFRPWGADQIAVAGCRWATPHLEVGEIEPTPNRAVQGRLEDFARTRLGVQGALGVRWAWIEDHSCDQLPIVGPLPGSARWVACVGMGANEWSLGRAAGRMVVDGLVGDARSTPSMFSPGRFVG